MKFLLSAILGLCLGFIPVSSRANITFDDTSAYPAGFSLSTTTYTTGSASFSGGVYSSGGSTPPTGASDWVTTDLHQKDDVDQIPGYSSYVGDQWALFGGGVALSTAPSQNHVELWQPLNISGDVSFSVNFAITSSTTPYAANDSFGWTFRDQSLNSLFEIVFTASISNPGSILDVGWIGASGTVNHVGTVGRNSPYTLTLNTNLLQSTFAAAITDSFSGTLPFSGTTVPGTGIGSVAATMDVPGNISTSGYGSNLMIFNNYNVVPEPSSYALFFLGGCALLALVRRRRIRCNRREA